MTVGRALAVGCARTGWNCGGTGAGRPCGRTGSASGSRHAAACRNSACRLAAPADDCATAACRAGAAAVCGPAAACPTAIAGATATACPTAATVWGTAQIRAAPDCNRASVAEKSAINRPAVQRRDLRCPSAAWHRVSAAARGAPIFCVVRQKAAAQRKKRTRQCHRPEGSWCEEMWKNHLASELTFARVPSKGRRPGNLALRGDISPVNRSSLCFSVY